MLTPEQERAFAEITPTSEDDKQHLDFLRKEIERLNEELALIRADRDTGASLLKDAENEREKEIERLNYAIGNIWLCKKCRDKNEATLTECGLF